MWPPPTFPDFQGGRLPETQVSVHHMLAEVFDPEYYCVAHWSTFPSLSSRIVDVNTTEVPVIGTFVREPDHPVYGFAMREDIAWCITRLLEKFSNLLFSWRIRQFAYRA
ncbi:hypothetical protein FRC20_005329 [Serendipita sp. 405]|nr:hypothetical protein FRC16_003426 [Serendipita sp. 398]KAG8811669.1 hypothetical protein FRC18_003353 [Serendipita sp. 400]KAG8840952.1 hypothetical protein FRC20_005329 [Serendipita sp. 405]